MRRRYSRFSRRRSYGMRSRFRGRRAVGRRRRRAPRIGYRM